jgi:hypothetical protein
LLLSNRHTLYLKAKAGEKENREDGHIRRLPSARRRGRSRHGKVQKTVFHPKYCFGFTYTYILHTIFTTVCRQF